MYIHVKPRVGKLPPPHPRKEVEEEGYFPKIQPVHRCKSSWLQEGERIF
jgi:hypothetical protein